MESPVEAAGGKPVMNLKYKASPANRTPSVIGHIVDGDHERFYDGFALYDYDLTQNTVQILYPGDPRPDTKENPEGIYTPEEYCQYIRLVDETYGNETLHYYNTVQSIREQAELLQDGTMKKCLYKYFEMSS